MMIHISKSCDTDSLIGENPEPTPNAKILRHLQLINEQYEIRGQLENVDIVTRLFDGNQVELKQTGIGNFCKI